ncbi:MAG TPA: sterol desaturase family protein, partial [Bradyrhizobium sp.]|nr:sterol desaturase family protein [Bradyrhizobium sp.]
MSSEISNAVFCAAVLLGIVYGSRILEKTWPIAPVSGDEFRADWLAVIVSVGLEHLFAPLAAISAGAIASYVGLGWI